MMLRLKKQFCFATYLFICVSLQVSVAWLPLDSCDTKPADGCTCYDFGADTTVVCSHLNLTNVRQLTIKDGARISYMDLSYNSFTDLQWSVFRSAPIRSLDFSHNEHYLRINTALVPSQLEVLNLADTHQTSVPEAVSIMSHLYELDLSMNNIRVLKQGTFRDMVNLKILHLNGNPIEDVESYALFGIHLDQLSLTLSYEGYGCTDVCLLMYGNIEAIQGLKALTLTGSYFRIVDIVFASSNLEYLELTDSSLFDYEVADLPRHGNVRGIHALSLSDNALQSVPTNLEFFTSLNFLYLTSNLIRSIGIADFRGMDQLTHIYLNKNYLTYVDADTLLRLGNLQYLDLSDNQILSFECSGWPNVNEMIMDVSGNILECDCNIAGLIDLVGHQEETGQGPFGTYSLYNLECTARGRTMSILEAHEQYPSIVSCS